MQLTDRDILVTGCAGFIASHLVERLLAKGNRVIGVDNLSAGKREFMSKMMVDRDFKFIEGDLQSMDLSSAMSGCDVLCHFAANPDVRLGAKNTKIHYDQNISVTYRLLEASKDDGITDIMFPSTSTIYGETSEIPTHEDYGPLIPLHLWGVETSVRGAHLILLPHLRSKCCDLSFR